MPIDLNIKKLPWTTSEFENDAANVPRAKDRCKLFLNTSGEENDTGYVPRAKSKQPAYKYIKGGKSHGGYKSAQPVTGGNLLKS